ncbi:GA module-containing protein, partial [Pseudomonas aeruginosa]|nr:GA module-containing protein [Pseudomonas aeruginosa]
AVTDQINGAHTVDEANQIKQNAQNLNTAMGNLKQAIADKDATKATVNFTDADEAKRNAYTNAVTQAEQILNKAQGPNTAKDGVETALENVQRAKNELNGNQNVANAKTTAKNALNGDAKLIAAQNAAKQHLGTLTHITTAQRNDLTNQISQATNLAGVESVKQSANSLDGAMGNLQTAINDKSGTLASQNFLDVDEQKRNAYNQAVSNAETILNKQ